MSTATDITFARLCELEPALLDLVTACHKATWMKLHFRSCVWECTIKAKVRSLVGWYRFGGGDDVLDTSDAYDCVVKSLLEILGI